MARALVANPRLPAADRAKLLAQPDEIPDGRGGVVDWTARRAVALVEDPAVLEHLASRRDPAVRRAVALHPRCGEPLRRRLLADADPAVRQAALSRATQATPPVVAALEALAEPNAPSASRQEAGAHPLLPAGLIQRLADDSDWRVRAKIAARSDAPGPLLTRLAQDPYPGVRWAVAGNPSAGPDLLRSLAEADSGVWLALAGNPSCPADWMERLARDTNKAVRFALAINPSASDAVLAELLRDSEVSVVGAVLSRQGRLPSHLNSMGETPGSEARENP